MTLEKFNSITGVEHLRLMVRNFNDCREDFLDKFSAPQLLKLHRAWMLSEWDIYPDQWTARQVREALRGKPPQWDDQERPVYS